MRPSLMCVGLFIALAALAAAEELPPAPPVAGGIGVIDSKRVLHEYQDHQASMKKLRAEWADGTEQQLREQRDKINQLMEQLKTCQPGTPEYAAMEKLVTEIQLDCWGSHPWRQPSPGLKKQFLEMETDLQRIASAKVDELVAEYAREHELTLVMNSSIRVGYIGTCDITDEIIARLNSPRRR